MNVSKTLSSAVAAATIVGAVGLAYAQSTSDPATPAADSTMAPSATSPATTPSTSTDSTTSTMPQSTTTTTQSDTSVAAPSADLQPKADRN